MEINGTTKLLGLIGNPVEHTLSPVIHNTIAACQQKKSVYVPFPVKENLEAAIKGAYSLGIQGMNVTVPYKSDVIPFLKEIEPMAKSIGAVNTLVRVEGGYKGYNTDLTGLYRALCEADIDLKGRSVIVLGAGGAGRAAAFMSALHGAKKIYILNRTPEKAKTIEKEIREKLSYENIHGIAMTKYHEIEEKNCLVLQATKVGLYPNVSESPMNEEGFFSRVGAVYDLIYTPWETAFMKQAKDLNIPAYNGLTMLLYQGVLAYELFMDTTVTKDSVKKAFDALKGNFTV